MTPVSTDAFTALAADRGGLARSSTAERVADIMRERITDGSLAPGSRLPEDAVGSALGVSRNTLREAFRLLVHERLAMAEFNRGVFVRRLTRDDDGGIRVDSIDVYLLLTSLDEAPPSDEAVGGPRHDALRFGKTLDDGGAGQIARLEEFARLVASVVGRPML